MKLCTCGNVADTTLYRSEAAQRRDNKPAAESVCQLCAQAAGGSKPVRVSGPDPRPSASGRDWNEMPFWT